MVFKLFYLKYLPRKGRYFLMEMSWKSSKFSVQNLEKTGVILQNDYLIPFLNVYQNIEIACEIQRNTSDIKSKMSEILAGLLENIKNEKIRNLSNSERQKL